MVFKDPEVIKMMNKVRSSELEYYIETYPEDERLGRDDMEILMSELDYLIEMFETDGCCTHEDLTDARRILRETDYGKIIPLDQHTLKPVYPAYKVQEAKDLVNEYGRLKRLQQKLFYL